MPEELQAKIVQIIDDTELKPGGGARPTTRIRFTLGEHGPFEHVFDRAPSRVDMDRVINARRDALRDLV